MPSLLGTTPLDPSQQGGIRGRDAWSRPRPRPHQPGGGSFFELSAAIGPGRANRREDLLKLESLLANAGQFDLKPTRGPQGEYDERHDTAIRNFQTENDLTVDGVLEPGGETITALETLLGSRLAGYDPPGLADAEANARRTPFDGPSILVYDREPHWPIVAPIRPPDHPPVDREANRRTVDGLFRYSVDGTLPSYAARAIRDYGARGLADVADLIAQIGARDPARGARFSQAVGDRLPEPERTTFYGGTPPDDPPLGVRARAATDGEERQEPSAAEDSGPNDRAADQTAQAGQRDADPYGDGAVPREPAPYRAAVIATNPGARDDFNRAVRNRDEATPNRRFTFDQIYVAEGGVRPDGNTSTGITPETLDRARREGWAEGLKADMRPADLTAAQRAAIMERYLEGEMRRAGGVAALDAIGDKYVAAAVGDALYRHSGTKATRAMQEAVNDILPNRLVEDGSFGPQTRDAIRDVAADPAAAQKFVDALADWRERDKKDPGDKARAEHFRFRNEMARRSAPRDQ